MKTVTATAAIDSGRYQPDSRVSGKNGKVISGTPLNNFGGEDYGDITLTDALTNSVNTVWAEVGVKLGRDDGCRSTWTASASGRSRRWTTPTEQMFSSGPRRKDKILPMSSDRVDVGPHGDRPGAAAGHAAADGDRRADDRQRRHADGAAAGGKGDRSGRPHGARSRCRSGPSASCRAESAAKLETMMKSVVREGSGTAAALEGVEVAGKTGTAEINIEQGINDLWFIGFAGDVAVAVIIEREQGQGGTVAAPIAKQILQALGQ